MRHVTTLALLVAILCSAQVAWAQGVWLGLRLEVVSEEDARKLGIDGGLRVTRVDDKSPAAEAGFEVGDVVLSAGEAGLKSIEEMRDVLAKARPGDLLSFGVRRTNGKNEPLLVTLGSNSDKDDPFGEDARVRELRRQLREKDAERRRLARELERRLEDLRNGRAQVEREGERRDPDEPIPVRPDPEEAPKPTPAPTPTTLHVTIGAAFVNLSPEQCKQLGIEGGISVSSVVADGAAGEAGLKVGDVVLKANGEAITGTGHLRTVMSKLKAGDKLELEIRREGKDAKVVIVTRARQ